MISGSDASSVFTAKRGIERVLFWVTVVLSALFFGLALAEIIARR